MNGASKNFILKDFALYPALSLLISLLLFATCSEQNGRIADMDRDRQDSALIMPHIDGNEPPANRYLADSPWPMSHRNPYCQASSPYPGPVRNPGRKALDYTAGWSGLITIVFSGPYPDGKRVIWGNSMTSVFKADPEGEEISYIHKIEKKGSSRFDVDAALSGAYTLLDRDGIFYFPSMRKIHAYGDKIKGDRMSGIEEKGHFEIPENILPGKNDRIVGFNITGDGMLAIATKQGLLCVVSRTFDRMEHIQLGRDEEISNSIACDERGGIYIVTSKKMYRVQWTGKRLSVDEADGGWIADYETGGDVAGVRLGEGSGSTPTLMGTGEQDRFVVITDGQKLMHLVFFWRDAIPYDWKQLPGTKDRRIAAQVPVTFGNPGATESLSEQSVCIRGYGALVVNNQLKMNCKSRIWSIYRSGSPAIAPYGAEKFTWNPVSKTLISEWANSEISLPSGIPCMSAATNLIYNIGQRHGVWTFEALDWHTGKSSFHTVLGVADWYNSAYAATEIGPGRCLFSGTLLGFIKLHP